VNQRVKGAFGTLEGLSQALGIDIQQVLQTAAARSSLPPSQPVEAPTASEDRNA
jgi:hypothetical protein